MAVAPAFIGSAVDARPPAIRPIMSRRRNIILFEPIVFLLPTMGQCRTDRATCSPVALCDGVARGDVVLVEYVRDIERQFRTLKAFVERPKIETRSRVEQCVGRGLKRIVRIAE